MLLSPGGSNLENLAGSGWLSRKVRLASFPHWQQSTIVVPYVKAISWDAA